MDFVCVALYRKNITEAFFLQMEKLYPESIVYLVTPKKDFAIFEKLNFKNIKLIDEDSVVPNMDMKSFKKKFQIEMSNRLSWSVNWFWQQYIKLYSYRIEGLSEKYIIIDMDFLMLKRIKFFDNEKHIFNLSVFDRFFRTHLDIDFYKSFNEKALLKPSAPTELISEYMPFEKEVVKGLLKCVEEIHKKPFMDATFSLMNNEEDVILSEYSLYSSYVQQFHRTKYSTCTLKYKRTGSDFYANYPAQHILKIFKDIWGLDAVAFENWQWKSCVPTLHIAVAYCRKIFNYYGTLPLTLPYIHTPDDLVKPSYWKAVKLRCRLFNMLDYRYWWSKKSRIIYLALIFVAWAFYNLL